MRLARILRLAAVFAVGIVTACSVLVDADRAQCTKNDDCAGHGIETVCIRSVCTLPVSNGGSTDAGVAVEAALEDPTWGCLGKTPQRPVEEPTALVPAGVIAADLVAGKPLVGLLIKACLSSDPSCANPHASGTTDATGAFSTTLYSGFRGYFDFVTEESFPKVLPSLAYIEPIPDKNTTSADGGLTPVGLVEKDGVALIAAGSGKEVKADYGHFSFGVHDCSARWASDAFVRMDPIAAETFVFYTDPSGAPGLTQGKTSVNGHGGFVNLPPGVVRVSVSNASGREIATRDVIIRAGTVTLALLSPKL